VHTVLCDAAFPAVALIALPSDVTFGTLTSSDTGDNGDLNSGPESVSNDSQPYVAALVNGIIMCMQRVSEESGGDATIREGERDGEQVMGGALVEDTSLFGGNRGSSSSRSFVWGFSFLVVCVNLLAL
jgi:hypothetical protein